MESENKDRLLLVGGGNFCESVIDALDGSSWTPGGVVDNNPLLKEVGGVPVLGHETKVAPLRKDFSAALITLDFHAGPRVRVYLVQLLKNLGYNLPTFISPLAHVSNDAEIGEGCIIMPHAVIGAGAKVGSHSIVDANASMMANAEIGEYSWLAPDASMREDVKAGRGVRIGQGAKISAGVKLGKRCFIDSGADVRRDVPIYKIVRG